MKTKHLMSGASWGVLQKVMREGRALAVTFSKEPIEDAENHSFVRREGRLTLGEDVRLCSQGISMTRQFVNLEPENFKDFRLRGSDGIVIFETTARDCELNGSAGIEAGTKLVGWYFNNTGRGVLEIEHDD